MSKTLDLGCGGKQKNPFNADELFGVDVRDDLGANIKKADLVIEPIPFEDETFDYVTAFDFLEHIPRIVYLPHRRNAFIEVMNEVYRVLKTGGLFFSLTPAYPHVSAFQDPTHVNFITEETLPLYFDDINRWASIYGFNGAFRIVTHELHGSAIHALLQKVPVPVPYSPVTDANRKISVFLPVYNGEKFLKETLDSLQAQTLIDFEVICIDDCSTDSSLSILQEYSEKDQRFRVFQTPSNLGIVPKVLNYSKAFMTGGYFIYTSQDDLFSTDWLSSLRTRAIATGADAVIPDVVFHHADNPTRNRTLSGLNGDRSKELSGRDAFYYSLDWTIPGNALWNASLVQKNGFDDFAMNADELSVRKYFLQCNKVVFCDGRFYYRQDNENAITKKISCKTFDYPLTQFRLYELARENQFPVEIIHREAIKVVQLIQNSRALLPVVRDKFSTEDFIKAQARLDLCTELIKKDPMFAQVI